MTFKAQKAFKILKGLISLILPLSVMASKTVYAEKVTAQQTANIQMGKVVYHGGPYLRSLDSCSVEVLYKKDSADRLSDETFRIILWSSKPALNIPSQLFVINLNKTSEVNPRLRYLSNQTIGNFNQTIEYSRYYYNGKDVYSIEQVKFPEGPQASLRLFKDNETASLSCVLENQITNSTLTSGDQQ